MPKTQKTPPNPKKSIPGAQKVDFSMKRAKQRYRAASHMMMEGAKMPPLKEWIKKYLKSLAENKMSEKLEKLVLQ